MLAVDRWKQCPWQRVFQYESIRARAIFYLSDCCVLHRTWCFVRFDRRWRPAAPAEVLLDDVSGLAGLLPGWKLKEEKKKGLSGVRESIQRLILCYGPPAVRPSVAVINESDRKTACRANGEPTGAGCRTAVSSVTRTNRSDWQRDPYLSSPRVDLFPYPAILPGSDSPAHDLSTRGVAVDRLWRTATESAATATVAAAAAVLHSLHFRDPKLSCPGAPVDGVTSCLHYFPDDSRPSKHAYARAHPSTDIVFRLESVHIDWNTAHVNPLHGILMKSHR